ncbi:MAG: hypothetical protein J6A17_01560 [Bacilli bacterium]|nr:hypothetical protein [Bacilli bacterium]
MEKKAKITLKNEEEVIKYELLIEFKNNKISYIENDSNNTSVLLDLNNKLLIRDNKELYLEYDFLNNKGVVYLKELRNNMNINLNTIKYEITDNKIEIMYKIDENSYEYFIEME